MKDKTNFDIYNYSVTLNTNDIRHIFNRHKTSNYSFEIPIDRTNVFTIIETIINPDKIEPGRYGKSLKFIKTLDYVYTAIELAYKNKTISLKTSYINKINGLKNVLMLSNNRVANNTSETHSNAVYNSNSTDNNEDINTKNENNGIKFSLSNENKTKIPTINLSIDN